MKCQEPLKLLFILLIGIPNSSLFGQTLNLEKPSISNTDNWKASFFSNIENSTYIDSWQIAMSINGVNICYSDYYDVQNNFLPDNILQKK